jgi:hypothetical protein
MEQLHIHLQEQMLFVQAAYEKSANETRTASPRHRVGDLVWLDMRNIKTVRPTKKLDIENAGPFEIVEVVSPRAYRLKLPPEMQIHDVFQTSLLRLVTNDPPPGQAEHRQPPPSEVIDRDGVEEEEWAVESSLVESILDSKLKGKKTLMYNVQWMNDTSDWRVPEELIPGCEQAIYPLGAGLHAKFLVGE